MAPILIRCTTIARFVHVTDARLAASIKRAGLRPPTSSRFDGSIYCVPVTRDFSVTFQWVRELRRSGYRTSIAVTFLVPDTEIVMVGRYAEPASAMTAAQAVAFFASGEKVQGVQVTLRRKIDPKDIKSIRPAPANVGWRYFPEAKGREPYWPIPGTINARRLRNRINAKHE